MVDPGHYRPCERLDIRYSWHVLEGNREYAPLVLHRGDREAEYNLVACLMGALAGVKGGVSKLGVELVGSWLLPYCLACPVDDPICDSVLVELRRLCCGTVQCIECQWIHDASSMPCSPALQFQTGQMRHQLHDHRPS